ncbi:MAG: hypothetical protein IJP93_11655 [Bacteroidales bacterium]|nr:hypothetical protein [Bacteroidales bacterium]
MITRGKIQKARNGGGKASGVLIVYASFPECIKQAYIAKYGDPEQKEIEEKMEFRLDIAASAWYHDDARGLDSKYADRYTVNASVLQMLSTMKFRMRGARGGARIDKEAILRESERLRNICNHTLPKSRRLLEVLDRFEKEGYACLVSGKLGNSNSRVITDEMGRYILALKRSMNPVYDIDGIFHKVNEVASARGWKEVKSKTSIINYLNEHIDSWLDAEIGGTKAKMVLNRQHSTILPTMSNARWEGDGTKVNLYYRVFVEGKWQMATTTVYEFIDCASEVMLGRSYGKNENFQMLYEALRHAVEFAGVFPYEMVNDNQSSARTAMAREWLSHCVHIPRTTAPHNGPSKTIENIFGRFQEKYLHKFWFFTGQNITARKRGARPNMDRILQNIAGLPLLQECIGAYESCVDEWNNSLHPNQKAYPGLSRMDVFRRNSYSGCVSAEDAARTDAWWLKSEKPVAYTNAGLSVVINGEKLMYEVVDDEGYPNLDWLDANNGKKFFYSYDPFDLSVVKLYSWTKAGGYKFEARAEAKRRIHRDIASQTEEEMAWIREMERRGKEHAVARDLRNRQLEWEQGVAPEQHGLRSSLPGGVSRTEYERIADNLQVNGAEAASEIYPDSIGKMQKRVSGLDLEALNNM